MHESPLIGVSQVPTGSLGGKLCLFSKPDVLDVCISREGPKGEGA